MEKAQARQEIQRRIAQLSAEQRREASERIRRLVGELPEFRRARAVLLFVSMPDEADTLGIIADALAAGKTVAVPKVDRKRKVMHAVLLRALHPRAARPPTDLSLGERSPADGGRVRVPSAAAESQAPSPLPSPQGRGGEVELDLAPGVFGILEPQTTDVVEPGVIDFVLVPARGFDRAGNRLGRGGGYYDRYMSQPGFRAVRCGIGFGAQVLDAVPHAGHDLPVQLLVTETGTLRFALP